MNLIDIKGVGEKTLSLLNKLNIYDIEDLYEYYPYRYEVLKRSDINSLNQDDRVVIDGYLEENAKIFRYGKKNRMTFRFNTGSNLLNVIIFNRGFLKDKLTIGINITLIGKYDKLHNTIIASDIRFSSLGDTTKIEPIYHETSGITSKKLNEYIINTFPYIENTSYIPEYLEEKYNFLDRKTSIMELHNVTSTSNYKKALSRLKFEEFFEFMYKMNYLKNESKNRIGLERHINKEEVDKLINSLPFQLTTDQLKSIDEIYNDLISKNRMNRLLQGDVGSGKTIVSFIALYINYLSNYQGALMAPTEILANQHYINIKKIFKDYNINIELITGSTTKKDKKRIYEELETGKIDIIVGTVALIQEKIKYKNLGLVITDEQHRFGVLQRKELKNKGITPDILYMSATPIPRTYALTLYGDMDVSSIKSMPKGRIPVVTSLYKMKDIKEVLTRMLNELKQNHQIYVISPLIEGEDELNIEQLNDNLHKAFKNYNIGILHGRMDNLEKDKVMTEFKENKIQILISTTVIEVGVDVENASMIVIFDAHKFGLSQLHQLRGRVGRSSIKSYCILVSDEEKERLNILTTTTDGYKISEEDFKLRGSGDLLGIRQSGDMSFKLVDIKKDYNILLLAKEEVEYSIKNNLITKELQSKLTQIDNLD